MTDRLEPFTSDELAVLLHGLIADKANVLAGTSELPPGTLDTSDALRGEIIVALARRGTDIESMGKLLGHDPPSDG